jgi:hypothetical protein
VVYCLGASSWGVLVVAPFGRWSRLSCLGLELGV